MFCFAFLRGNRRITFQGFDWSGLLERNLKPPMNPVIQSSTDTSNFDRYRLYTQSKHCHSWGLHNNLLHWIPFMNVFGLAFYIFGISPLWSLTWSFHWMTVQVPLRLQSSTRRDERMGQGFLMKDNSSVFLAVVHVIIKNVHVFTEVNKSTFE